MIQVMIKFYISLLIIVLIPISIDGNSQLSKGNMKHRTNRKIRHNTLRNTTINGGTGEIEELKLPKSTSRHNLTLPPLPRNLQNQERGRRIMSAEKGLPKLSGIEKSDPTLELKPPSTGGIQAPLESLPRNLQNHEGGQRIMSSEKGLPKLSGIEKSGPKLELNPPSTGGIQAPLESLPTNLQNHDGRWRKMIAENGLPKLSGKEKFDPKLELEPPSSGDIQESLLKNITGHEPKLTTAEKGLSKNGTLDTKSPSPGNMKTTLESLPRNMTGHKPKITEVETGLPKEEDTDRKLDSKSLAGEATSKLLHKNITRHEQKITQAEKASPKTGNVKTNTKLESKSLAAGSKTTLKSITENKPKVTTKKHWRPITASPHFSLRKNPKNLNHKTEKGNSGHESNSTKKVVKRVRHAGRIINGTQIEELPFLVSIQAQNTTNKEWTHGCGGSILTTTAVVSACHCIGLVVGKQIIYGNHHFMRIIAGTDSIVHLSPSAQIRKVSKLLRHPKSSNNPESDNGWFINDVSLIVVKTPFVFNAAVQPMKLFSHSKQRAIVKLKQMVDHGETCVVPGWGSTDEFEVKHPKYLMASTVKLIPDDSCREIFCERTQRHCNSDFNSIGQVCGISKDSSDCQGDSGGPLVCNGQVFGIVSYGERCMPEWPSVFQGIGPIMELIKIYTQAH